MKITFFVLFIGHLFTSSAQDVFVIEKSEKTGILFDATNPLSLIGLLKIDATSFKKSCISGIAESDLNLIPLGQRIRLPTLIGRPGVTPVTYTDPNEPNFGEPKLFTSEEGWQSYLYENPDTLIYDLSDISRIIVEMDTMRVTSITFCKIYTDNYVPVLYLKGNDLLSMDGFKFVQEFEGEMNERLKADYFVSLKDSIEHSNSSDQTNTVFTIFPESYMSRVPALRIDPTCESATYEPYGYSFAEMDTSDPSYLDSIREHFNGVRYREIQPTAPLIEVDPNSPNFGELLRVTDPTTGETSFVYDPVWIKTLWLDFDPELYGIHSVERTETGELTNQLHSIIGCADINGEMQVVFEHVLTKKWYKNYFENAFDTFDWKKWQDAIGNCIQLNGSVMDLGNSRDVEALNMSPSYLPFIYSESAKFMYFK